MVTAHSAHADTFFFATPEYTLRARGELRTWTRPEEAARAGTRIVGALPFFPEEDAVLSEPHHFSWGAPERGPAGEGPAPTWEITGLHSEPSREEHAARVASARERIRRGEMDKVVLSRAIHCEAAGRIDPMCLAERCRAGSGLGIAHMVRWGAGALVGSTPEVLIKKKGRMIESFPLAGTAPRSADPVQDEALATELQLSHKDIHEHRYVTQAIKQVLSPYCARLDVPEEPSLTSTSHTWHLGTPIRGELHDERVPVLELAAALHPTPAVGGFPLDPAMALLRAEEPGRGLYAGAVGWMDLAGDGEWRVTIRSAVIEGQRITARVGGGIVADSEPEEEVRETATKFGPIRAALGLSAEAAAVRG